MNAILTGLDKELADIIAKLPSQVYCPQLFKCCKSIEDLSVKVPEREDYLSCFNGQETCNDKIALFGQTYCLCPVRYLIYNIHQNEIPKNTL